MENEEFYEICADILGATHEGRAFTQYKRTRWNNRTPGRGRYPGFGIIRLFGNIVHVALLNPVTVTRTFDSREEAIAFLRELPR